MPDYVEQSYQEALINAVVHRDYQEVGSEVHVDIFDDRLEIYSPGGMMDGSLIQECDPFKVPSERRNPVLADIFEKLGYMSRTGSGFGKIIDGYTLHVNYTKDKHPRFRSNRNDFVVILPSLSFSGQKGSQDYQY